MCFYYIITFVSLQLKGEALYNVNLVLSSRDISFIISLLQEHRAPKNIYYHIIITFVSLLEEEKFHSDIKVELSKSNMPFIISLLQEHYIPRKNHISFRSTISLGKTI